MKYYAVKGFDVFGTLIASVPYGDDLYFFPCKVVQDLGGERVEIKFTHPITAALVTKYVEKKKVVDIDVKILMQMRPENEPQKYYEKTSTELIEHFNKIKKANQDGYVGMLPNGNLVDRRENPEGWPIAANLMFSVTEPRCVRCNNVAPISEILKSLCYSCRTK